MRFVPAYGRLNQLQSSRSISTKHTIVYLLKAQLSLSAPPFSPAIC